MSCCFRIEEKDNIIKITEGTRDNPKPKSLNTQFGPSWGELGLTMG